jgi:hypothetical protein
MNLTIQQKIEAYQWAKERIESSRSDYLCLALKAWIRRNRGEEPVIIPTKVLEETFPEILRYRPEDKDSEMPWWPNDDTPEDNIPRIKAIEEIIESLKDMLPVEE